MPDVAIRDENSPSAEVIETLLRLECLKISARELIAERVRAECDNRLFDRKGRMAVPLVEPSARERELNGHGRIWDRRTDAENRINVAHDAFGRNAYVMLVDDRQVVDLDEIVELKDNSVVTFLRLTPLVGG